MNFLGRGTAHPQTPPPSPPTAPRFSRLRRSTCDPQCSSGVDARGVSERVLLISITHTRWDLCVWRAPYHRPTAVVLFPDSFVIWPWSRAVIVIQPTALMSLTVTRNDSVPIQLAQCWFPGLAVYLFIWKLYNDLVMIWMIYWFCSCPSCFCVFFHVFIFTDCCVVVFFSVTFYWSIQLYSCQSVR